MALSISFQSQSSFRFLSPPSTPSRHASRYQWISFQRTDQSFSLSPVGGFAVVFLRRVKRRCCCWISILEHSLRSANSSNYPRPFHVTYAVCFDAIVLSRLLRYSRSSAPRLSRCLGLSFVTCVIHHACLCASMGSLVVICIVPRSGPRVGFHVLFALGVSSFIMTSAYFEI